ncbi:orotidine-5'-phosphate decarboxylase [Fodinisporobacter ferrooxydans]|uniref:Orotidine 5'-phosphate decarboxylase n=1 Tax=Fodinisporobacter ferrooxydans TaxID=2901836 RepID=A0ABY4CQV0_9BACL|nr:orotidine-5'-phosphate decarboxylase [Alicyclobacillaceae bacterium MYW30-H2]
MHTFDASRIYIALDTSSVEQARAFVRELAPTGVGFKVGMQLFYQSGPAFVKELTAQGLQVFLDLKFHDIPNTVAGAVQSIGELGAAICNVHVAGGLEMMKRARQAADALAQRAGKRPQVIGVTQLTSTSREMMNEEVGIPGDVQDVVIRYALLAQTAGLDGVVASGHEVRGIREACGDDFVTVIPGIRLAANDSALIHDQKRVMTPHEAFQEGAHAIVIGRAVTQAAEPRATVEQILAAL